MPKGYLCLVLHTHLPFVRHPEFEDSLEERWLFEAITETYIPLLKVFYGLKEDNIDFKLTMSFSPTLTAMLSDYLLQERYLKHISKLIELAEKEVDRTKGDKSLNNLSLMYLEHFQECKYFYEDVCKRDLISQYSKLQESGNIEIITCSATHCFSPVFEEYPNAIKAQLKVGCESYQKYFKTKTKGIWNGECGYFPGLDNYLAEEGINYFFLDTHGILNAKDRPFYGIYAPIYCKSGVAAFGRDPDSSRSVWSCDEGYPGDQNYRDFYRDIGFDLDFEYIKPYIHSTGSRIMTGIKYNKISNKTDEKKGIYNRRLALGKALTHANDFIDKRIIQIKKLNDMMDRPPLLIAPYDTELFGHWWYEGPQWLDYLFRLLNKERNMIELITPSLYLKQYSENQVTTPSFSSWGLDGYSKVWLDESNNWMYKYLHRTIEQMTELANDYKDASGITKLALNQCAREILLAQASDWPFIMNTNTVVEYARNRIETHISRFNQLYQMVKENNIDKEIFRKISSEDNIFPDIDYRIYCI